MFGRGRLHDALPSFYYLIGSSLEFTEPTKVAELLKQLSNRLERRKVSRQAGKKGGKREHCPPQGCLVTASARPPQSPPAATLTSFSVSQRFVFNSVTAQRRKKCSSCLRGLAKSCCDNEWVHNLLQDTHRHFNDRSIGACLHSRHCLFFLKPLVCSLSAKLIS